VSPKAYQLELPAWIQIHQVQPVSHLDVVVEDPFICQRVEPPPLVEINGEEEYQVSSVEDSRVYRNQLQYLIKWTGYDSLTWAPVKLVDGFQAVDEFDQRYWGNPGPLENGLGAARASGGNTVTAVEGTKVLGNNELKIRRMWKELCHKRAETLADAETAARWWRYNLL
jgi:hypothetical protein